MTVRIQRVGQDGAALFGRVADGVFDTPIDPDRLAAFLAEPRHLMVVAVQDGGVVGQARGIVHLSPDQPDELYIDNMGVAPPLWRRGIGGRLLDELLLWGNERGCSYAWLGTEPGNTAARALYASRSGEESEMVMVEYEPLPG